MRDPSMRKMPDRFVRRSASTRATTAARRARTAVSAGLLLLFFAGVALASTIDPWIERELRQGAEQEFFVVLDSDADFAAAAKAAGRGVRTKRVAAVRDALREHAARTQAPLREWLDRRGIEDTTYH